jgi:alkylhydroperoxidase family enzyme
VNGCDYCASAHTYLGKNLAKLSDDEIAANRNGASTDAKANAAVSFAVKPAQSRGTSLKRTSRRSRTPATPGAGDRDRRTSRSTRLPTMSTKP